MLFSYRDLSSSKLPRLQTKVPGVMNDPPPVTGNSSQDVGGSLCSKRPIILETDPHSSDNPHTAPHPSTPKTHTLTLTNRCTGYPKYPTYPSTPKQLPYPNNQHTPHPQTDTPDTPNIPHIPVPQNYSHTPTTSTPPHRQTDTPDSPDAQTLLPSCHRRRSPGELRRTEDER